MLNHTPQRPVREVYNEEKWTIKVIKCKMHSDLVSDECQNVILFDLNYTPLSVRCGPGFIEKSPISCLHRSLQHGKRRGSKYWIQGHINTHNLMASITAAYYLHRLCAPTQQFLGHIMSSVCTPIYEAKHKLLSKPFQFEKANYTDSCTEGELINSSILSALKPSKRTDLKLYQACYIVIVSISCKQLLLG